MAGNTALEMNIDAFRSMRKDFPVLRQSMNGKPLAYLDTASSAQKPMAVIEAMREICELRYSNIHRGLYRLSQDLTAEYEGVRQKAAEFLGAKSDKEIIFTGNSTEAINLVAASWGGAHLKEGDEVILTAMEHHANIVPWQLLQEKIGFNIKIVPILPDGTLDWDKLDGLLSAKTRLVSFVHISNALGTINPAKEITVKIKAYNKDIMVLIDGSQSAVHMDVDVADLGCDFFCFTGHKLYGPTGIGVLYGRAEVLENMPPYQGGGDMIDKVSFEGTSFKEPPYRFEAGTPPIAEVIGLGAAIDYISAIDMKALNTHEAEMLRLMTMGLKSIDGVSLYADLDNKAGIVSFNMDGLHMSDVAAILDQCGVAVRTGHHCCMPLMQAMGVEGTIRASAGLYTTKNDIDQLIEGLEKAKDMLA
ncbi:MAG: aminotransferase class V-fold PLP-dependent enzyme [Alphaproteobacteria bacterium]